MFFLANPVEPIEQITIAEYQQTAQSFREGTWDHDVSQNQQALIAAMPRHPGRILDVGCGPGRDLVSLKKMGHEVIGLDATPAFVDMAKEVSGCEVWEQCFLNLQLPDDYFDGIFANASLLHVPKAEMKRVLGDLRRSLVPQGAIMMSMARGDSEGWVQRDTGDRYVATWEYETLAPVVESAGFKIVNRYYRPPNLPPELQGWLVIVGQNV